MVDDTFLVDTVHTVVPDAAVHPTSLHGAGDHWHCVIVSPSFAGKRPLQRQQAILAAFQPAFADGRIHAMDLKCLTPEELETRFGGEIPPAFAPH